LDALDQLATESVASSTGCAEFDVSVGSTTTRLWISGRITHSLVCRRELFLWSALALAANEALQVVASQSLSSFGASLETQNYILWLAGSAFVYRVSASSRDRPADRLDFGFLAATCLSILVTSFLPHRWGIGLIATAIAMYLLFAHRGDRNLKAAGCLLLGMSAYLVWGPIFFQLVTPEAVRADALVVAGILKLLRPDILWTDTNFQTHGGHRIVLVGACSSFQNISTGLLACTTFAMLARTEFVRRDIIAVVFAIAAMVLSNAARLCLLAWDSTSFAFWHDGDGANLFVFGQTALVLLIAWWGAATWRREA
jgi:exosortase/archaeosortase family protein